MLPRFWAAGQWEASWPLPSPSPLVDRAPTPAVVCRYGDAFRFVQAASALNMLAAMNARRPRTGLGKSCRGNPPNQQYASPETRHSGARSTPRVHGGHCWLLTVFILLFSAIDFFGDFYILLYTQVHVLCFPVLRPKLHFHGTGWEDGRRSRFCRSAAAH